MLKGGRGVGVNRESACMKWYVSCREAACRSRGVGPKTETYTCTTRTTTHNVHAKITRHNTHAKITKMNCCERRAAWIEK